MPNVVAHLSYVVLATFTPGPNNIMSMSSGTRHGFRRTLPFASGVGLQFVNPKGILYGPAAPSTFPVSCYHSWIALGLFCVFMGAARSATRRAALLVAWRSHADVYRVRGE